MENTRRVGRCLQPPASPRHNATTETAQGPGETEAASPQGQGTPQGTSPSPCQWERPPHVHLESERCRSRLGQPKPALQGSAALQAGPKPSNHPARAGPGESGQVGAEAQPGVLKAGAQLAWAQEWGTGLEATPPLPTPTQQTQALGCRWEAQGRLQSRGRSPGRSQAGGSSWGQSSLGPARSVGTPGGKLPSPAWGQSPAQALGSLQERGRGGVVRAGASRTRPGTAGADSRAGCRVPPVSHPPRCGSKGPSRAPLFCDGRGSERHRGRS